MQFNVRLYLENHNLLLYKCVSKILCPDILGHIWLLICHNSAKVTQSCFLVLTQAVWKMLLPGNLILNPLTGGVNNTDYLVTMVPVSCYLSS